jgi:hypothetical protein
MIHPATFSGMPCHCDAELLNLVSDYTPLSMHVAGNELFYKRKYQEAAAHYTEAIGKNPNEPAVRIFYSDYTLYNIWWKLVRAVLFVVIPTQHFFELSYFI